MNATLIAEMEKESARLKALAQNIDAVIAAYRQPETANSSVIPRSPPPRRNTPAPAFELDAKADYSGMTQSDMCYAILKKANNIPLSREQILAQAQLGGVEIASVDNLSPVLSRDKRFKHIGRGHWVIATEE